MKGKRFELQKYINKLKVAKAPAYVIGQESGKALKNLYHPAFNQVQPFSKELQISEFYGKMKPDHEYVSEQYKHLLINLNQVDEQYANSKALEKRVQLAKTAVSQWDNFVKFSSSNLPAEEFKVREDILIKLEDIWMRFKV